MRNAIWLAVLPALLGAWTTGHAATAPVRQGAVTIRVRIPPQPRPAVVPVAVPVPELFRDAAADNSACQILDAAARLPAQFDRANQRVVFLLPLQASKAARIRSLRLQCSPGLGKAVFTIQEAERKFLHVMEGSAPVLTYNFGMILQPGVAEDRRRSSYVHPLYSPGGTVLTADFPPDHLHHRGLSWMWPNVDAAGRHYSLWDIRGIHDKFVRWIEKAAGPVFVRFRVDNGWFAGEKKLVREQADFTVFRATPQGRAVDVTLVFEALDQPVKLTGELPDRKGYGGLSLRFAPRQDTVITTPSGQEAKDTNLQPHPWADLAGRFGEGTNENVAGAAIFADPRNPGFPNGWTLRTYGFLGVAWPGLQPVTLELGKPVTLRYRLWLHDGAGDATLNAQYAAFANPLDAEMTQPNAEPQRSRREKDSTGKFHAFRADPAAFASRR